MIALENEHLYERSPQHKGSCWWPHRSRAPFIGSTEWRESGIIPNDGGVVNECMFFILRLAENASSVVANLSTVLLRVFTLSLATVTMWALGCVYAFIARSALYTHS